MLVTAVGLFGIGIIAGIASGLFGIGGGVVLVPLLIWIFGYSQLQASAASLAAMMLPLGALAGTYQYFRNGLISVTGIKIGFLISLGLFVGASLGGKIAPNVNILLIKRGFAVILFLSAIQLWFSNTK
jgi:uncharacterized membrane protein YfcA